MQYINKIPKLNLLEFLTWIYINLRYKSDFSQMPEGHSLSAACLPAESSTCTCLDWSIIKLPRPDKTTFLFCWNKQRKVTLSEKCTTKTPIVKSQCQTHIYFPDCINLSQLCSNCKKITAGEMTGWQSHLELEPICWVHNFLLLVILYFQDK